MHATQNDYIREWKWDTLIVNIVSMCFAHLSVVRTMFVTKFYITFIMLVSHPVVSLVLVGDSWHFGDRKITRVFSFL